jgi:hypothetical protein
LVKGVLTPRRFSPGGFILPPDPIDRGRTPLYNLAMSLNWTAKQLEAFKLLTSGKSLPSVAKQLKVSKSLVSKVKLSIDSGEFPPGYTPPSQNAIPPQGPPPTQSNINSVIDQFVKATQPEVDGPDSPFPGATHEPTPIPEEEETAGENPPSENQTADEPENQTVKQPQEKFVTPPPDITTVMKLVSVPVSCALTPIMQNARMYTIMRLGWRADMPWENFFDTCLALLFKSWGVALQGWYEEEPESVPVGAGVSPKPAWGNGNGNNGGATFTVDQKTMELAATIAQMLINEAALQKKV